MEQSIYYFVATVIATFSIVATAMSLFQINRNRKKQYEQKRREKTVEMIIYYANHVSKETKSVEKIVSTFTDEQCQDLYNCVPFDITEKTKEKICKVCPYKQECQKAEQPDTTSEDSAHTDETSEKEPKLKPCEKGKNKYYVSDTILYFIRGHIISYLNTLESVLLAWQLGIVVSDVIEEEFIFLDKKRQRDRALEVFRTIAGNGKSYPAIELFYQHLDAKRQEESQKLLKKIIK